MDGCPVYLFAWLMCFYRSITDGRDYKSDYGNLYWISSSQVCVSFSFAMGWQVFEWEKVTRDCAHTLAPWVLMVIFLRHCLRTSSPRFLVSFYFELFFFGLFPSMLLPIFMGTAMPGFGFLLISLRFLAASYIFPPHSCSCFFFFCCLLLSPPLYLRFFLYLWEDQCKILIRSKSPCLRFWVVT